MISISALVSKHYNSTKGAPAIQAYDYHFNKCIGIRALDHSTKGASVIQAYDYHFNKCVGIKAFKTTRPREHPLYRHMTIILISALVSKHLRPLS